MCSRAFRIASLLLMAHLAPAAEMGLSANWFSDAQATRLLAARIEPQMGAGPAGAAAGRLAGYLIAPCSGELVLTASGGDEIQVAVWVADLAQDGGRRALTAKPGKICTVTVPVTRGEAYDLQIRLRGGGPVSLTWQGPGIAQGAVPASALRPTTVAGLTSQLVLSAIGPIGAAGTISGDGTRINLSGAGDGIAGVQDSFQAAWADLRDDGTCTVRLITPPPGGRAGLVLRSDATPDGVVAALLVGADRTTQLIGRVKAGTAATVTGKQSLPTAGWLQLTRNGPSVCGYVSNDGRIWSFVGRVDIQHLASSVRIGLAVASGRPQTATAGFSDWRLIAMPRLGGGAAYGYANLVKMGTFEGLMNEQPQAPVDAQGWPTCDFRISCAGGNINAWGRRWIEFSFKGQAQVGGDPFNQRMAVDEQVYDPATNTTTGVIRFPDGDPLEPNKDYAGCPIRFSQTRRDAQSPIGSGITDLRIFSAGFPVDARETFAEDYREMIVERHPRILRMMVPSHAIDTDLNEWNQRSLPTDATPKWKTKPGWASAKGIPFEDQIRQANLAHADLWINLPIKASDDYIRQLARLLRDGSNVGGTAVKLDPDLNIYVELGNELWNGGGIYGPDEQYCQAQGRKAKNEKAVFGPNKVTVDYDGADHGLTLAYRWIAARLIHVSDILCDAKDGFGPAARNTRIRPVFATWQSFGDRTSGDGLDFIERGWGSVRDQIYSHGPVHYFGFRDLMEASGTAGGKGNTRDGIIEGVAREGAHYAGGGNALQYNAALAAKYGIALDAYEAGPAIGGSNAQTVAQFDVRMPQVIRQCYNAYWAWGGSTPVHFLLSNGPFGQPWGDWNMASQGTDLRGEQKVVGFDLTRSQTVIPPLVGGQLVPGAIDARRSASSGNGAPQALGEFPKNGRLIYALRSHDGGTYQLRLQALVNKKDKPQTIGVRLNDAHEQTVGLPGNSDGSLSPAVTVELRPGINGLELAIPKDDPYNLTQFIIWPAGTPEPSAAPLVALDGVGWWNWRRAGEGPYEVKARVIGPDPAKVTLTVTSTDPLLAPASSVVFTGSGAERKLIFTPAKGRCGDVSITVTATDPKTGMSLPSTFPIAVLPAPQTELSAIDTLEGVVLKWTNPSVGCPLNVMRSADPAVLKSPADWGRYAAVGTVADGVTTFTDRGAPGGMQFYYALRPKMRNGHERGSTAVGVKTAPRSGGGGMAWGAPNLFSGQRIKATNSSNQPTKLVDGSGEEFWFNQDGKNQSVTLSGLSLSAPIDKLLFWDNVGADGRTPAWVEVSWSEKDLSERDAKEWGPAKRHEMKFFKPDNVPGNLGNGKRGAATVGGVGIPQNAKSVRLVFSDTNYGTVMRGIQAFPAEASAPGVPAGIAATGENRIDRKEFTDRINSTMVVSWRNTATCSTAFVLERCADASFAKDVKKRTLAINTTSFEDEVRAGETVHYRVKAVNDKGESGWSEFAKATMPAYLAQGDAPKGLTASAKGSRKVELARTGVPDKATTIEVERALDESFTRMVTPLATLDAKASTYIDYAAEEGVTYWYRVRGDFGDHDGPAAMVKVDTPPIAPQEPARVTARIEDGNVVVRWVDRSINETGYIVERSRDSGFSQPQAFKQPYNSSRWRDGAVVAGETWYYRVFAVGSGGESPRSPAVSVTLPADFKPRPRFANAGFEVPDLGDRGETTELSSRWYDLGWNPTGPKNAAGIAARNNSAVAEKAVIPEGKQVGILRGEGGLQQTIDLPAGAWRVSFAVAQRTRDGNKTQAVQVQIDGKVVTIAGAPSVVPAPGSAFTPVVTDAATITAGSHTVLITGMVAGQSACIDDVRIVP